MKQRGFTLVELMISIVLFSIAMGGVLSVAVSIAQGFREQRAAIATEAQARMPMDFITDAIRQAGPAAPSSAYACTPQPGCLPANTTIQDVVTCEVGALNVTNSTAGPDTLTLLYASGAAVTATLAPYGAGITSLPVGDASQLSAGDMILISNLSQAHTVTVTAVNYGTNTLTLAGQACGSINWPGGGTYPTYSTVVRVKRATFSIVANTPGIVPADGIPVLMFDPDGAGPAAAEPLAEGVEDMQVALGVDVNGNGVIDAGEWAFDTAGHGALTGPILSAKIVLVSRATTIVEGGNATPFQEPVALDHQAPLNGPDVWRRRVLEATIEIRNGANSP